MSAAVEREKVETAAGAAARSEPAVWSDAGGVESARGGLLPATATDSGGTGRTDSSGVSQRARVFLEDSEESAVGGQITELGVDPGQVIGRHGAKD